MRKVIAVTLTIVVTVIFTLYEWFYYVGAASYCTGTSSAQYYGTLVCRDDGLFGLWLTALLNIVLAIGLWKLWSSSSPRRPITFALTGLCAAYVVFALIFSMQFWMFDPARGCYWAFYGYESALPCYHR